MMAVNTSHMHDASIRALCHKHDGSIEVGSRRSTDAELKSPTQDSIHDHGNVE